MEGIKFVLVDDDPATHCFHRLMIERGNVQKLPLRVEDYSSVDAAINALSVQDEQQLTYILLDLNMPLKTGWDFLEEFERLSSLDPRPQVFVVSSSQNPSHRKKALTYKDVLGYEPKFVSDQFFKSLLAKHSA